MSGKFEKVDRYFGIWKKDETETEEKIYVKHCMVIDLTENFGEGNEPDLEWCNKNIEYFKGNKEVKYIK